MALSDARILYGIHSFSPYNRSTKAFYGTLKVIGSANMALNAELEQLYAGSNPFAWAAERKTISTELTAKIKAYPGFAFELFLGATVTDNAADTSGAVTTLTNRNGTSLVNATTGVASVAVKAASKANLKFGKYVAKVTDAANDVITIYASSDIDFQRGTDESYDSDLLAVATATIPGSSATVDVDSFGLTFTGGSGTVAMTDGDTATFEVKPPSASSSDIIVGASTTSLPNFGALFYAQKRATGEMFEIDAPNVVGAGFPISLEENAFSQPEVKMTCLYDATLDRVFAIRTIIPS